MTDREGYSMTGGDGLSMTDREGYSMTGGDGLSMTASHPVTLSPSILRVNSAKGLWVVGSRRRYSGMLPCFLGGVVSALFRSISSARITRTRVLRGSMTSSM